VLQCVSESPVTGWWKELKQHERNEHRTHDAPNVSIETGQVVTDIGKPIANQVGVPSDLQTQVGRCISNADVITASA
jgi:hypothetical protein